MAKKYEDAIEALQYIMEVEEDDFIDSLSIDAEVILTEEESESIEDLDRDSEELARLIAKACNSGSMHIFARAYRGLVSIQLDNV
jgi:hypothetical protein